VAIDFTGAGLIKIATDIERSGTAFYDVMAATVKNAGAREVFQTLAEMERVHLRVFQGMATDAAKYRSTEKPADVEYIRALIRNAVFNADFGTSEAAQHVKSDRQAIELGIMAEKDSILLYDRMRDLMPDELRPVVVNILAEERKHLIMLTGVKKMASQ
jgi:rubrerythrin